MTDRIIIAIDPDVEASGLAIIDCTYKPPTIDYTHLPIPELIDFILELHHRATATDTPLKVYVEAGWINKTNWHLVTRDNNLTAAAKGRQAGRNHQVGLDICAFLAHYKIPYAEVAPLRKCWRGKDRKITHEELETVVSWVISGGMPRRRSNQEERDALLLAWVEAGLPIRL
jgi:hypothetical protein